MKRHILRCGLMFSALLAGVRGAGAQAMLADDIIILSKGQREQEKSRTTTTHLGGTPGVGSGLLRASPGSGESTLGERFGTPMRRNDVLSTASDGGNLSEPLVGARVVPTRRQPSQTVPLFGALDIPTVADEGPLDGLTLDQAIDRLAQANFGLKAKFQEIPKAEADVLSAGLRANPVVFGSADSVPYGNYSRQRPGENNYTVVLIQPVDVNQKRKVRVLVAQQAKKVLEAQYQDAVRTEIDNLYTTFVDVLDARESVRYAKTSLEGLNSVLGTTREQFEKQVVPESEVESAAIQRDTAEAGLEQADAALRLAKRGLAVLLDITPAEADRMEIRGSIRDEATPPPPLEDLIRLALCVRPDVVSYRLGVRRAQADVKLQKAERFPDVFVLYTPYGFRDNAPVGDQSATSWSFAVLASIPLLNRNQGNIHRAEHTVLQTRTELSGLERQAVSEVDQDYLEYSTTHSAVRRLEGGILPRARRLRDQKYTLYTQGQENVVSYLNAQRDFNEIVRQYRDALIRHRRSMLRLNTAVGQRISP